MNRLGVLTFGFGLMMSVGCSTITDSQTQKEPLRQAVTRSDMEEARRLTDDWVRKRESTGDELMWLLESGALAFYGGDFERSVRDFKAVETFFKLHDDEAVITVRDGVSEAGSLLTNLNAIPYRGQLRDRLSVGVFQTLNYLACNDLEGAYVEMRKMRFAQQQIDQTYRLEAAAQKASTEARRQAAQEY